MGCMRKQGPMRRAGPTVAPGTPVIIGAPDAATVVCTVVGAHVLIGARTAPCAVTIVTACDTAHAQTGTTKGTGASTEQVDLHTSCHAPQRTHRTVLLRREPRPGI